MSVIVLYTIATFGTLEGVLIIEIPLYEYDKSIQFG